MLFRDALRAQYYLPTLEKEFVQFLNRLGFRNSSSFLLDVDEFLSDLAIRADQMLLPTIAYEIDKANKTGRLSGKSPQERYKNFFIKNETYTLEARKIINDYPLIFEFIDLSISCAFQNLYNCIVRFIKDRDLVALKFFDGNIINIEKIELSKNADQHFDQQALILTLSNSCKIIYKPVGLLQDELFAEFVRSLDMQFPFDLHCMNIISRPGYGWIEFLDSKPCHSINEVKNFYRRTGAVLAIADALNYTDGHFENFFAYGQYPILLDGEAFFQNYSQGDEKNILATMLLQKIPQAGVDLHAFSSALQAFPGEGIEGLNPFPENERTDELRVHFLGSIDKIHHHCPKLNGQFYLAAQFQTQIMEGFTYAFATMRKQSKKILGNMAWWRKVARVKSRVVLRDTASYFYLIRKIQQPQISPSKQCAKKQIIEKLGRTPFTKYETSELLRLNIPYFLHCPSKKHLYDGNGRRYQNVFPKTAIEVLRSQFANMNERYKNFNMKIIERHLSCKLYNYWKKAHKVSP